MIVISKETFWVVIAVLMVCPVALTVWNTLRRRDKSERLLTFLINPNRQGKVYCDMLKTPATMKSPLPRPKQSQTITTAKPSQTIRATATADFTCDC